MCDRGNMLKKLKINLTKFRSLTSWHVKSTIITILDIRSQECYNEWLTLDYDYDYDYDLMWVKAQPVYPNNTNSYKNVKLDKWLSNNDSKVLIDKLFMI